MIAAWTEASSPGIIRRVQERLGLGGSALVLAGSALAVVACGAACVHEVAAVALPEELVFRGVVQGEVAARSGSPVLSVLAGASLFALAHVPGSGASGLLTFAPGLLFGLLRATTRSVWPAVAAHAVANVLWRGV